jgi:hypothetical protein
LPMIFMSAKLELSTPATIRIVNPKKATPRAD